MSSLVILSLRHWWHQYLQDSWQSRYQLFFDSISWLLLGFSLSLFIRLPDIFSSYLVCRDLVIIVDILIFVLKSQFIRLGILDNLYPLWNIVCLATASLAFLFSSASGISEVLIFLIVEPFAVLVGILTTLDLAGWSGVSVISISSCLIVLSTVTLLESSWSITLPYLRKISSRNLFVCWFYVY